MIRKLQVLFPNSPEFYSRIAVRTVWAVKTK